MKEKGFAPLIILIVIAVLGIGGYFVYKNYLSQSSKIIPATSPQPTATPSSTIDTSNWKKYINSNFGYSFKYPSDYKVIENQIYSADGVAVDTPNTTTILSSTLPNLKTNFQMSIHYENSPEDLSASQIAKKIGVQSSGTFTIDGNKGYIFKNVPGLYGSTNIYLHKNAGNYTFKIESHVNYEEIQSYTDSVLSTFKFTQ